MRPLEPEGSAGTAKVGLAAVAGLAALDTVADFAVFLMDGKQEFYQALGYEPRAANWCLLATWPCLAEIAIDLF
jgi:hypothetical protein